MILILDACTISNLLNVTQDTSIVNLLNKYFDEVYIAKEVIKEIHDNKYAYQSFYSSKEAINQLIADVKLEKYVSSLDHNKKECVPFIRNYAIQKAVSLKETDGEFHSTLLSLYLSRWGGKDFSDNNNKVLFATDDARAFDLYKRVFSTNQIGIIVESIDILVILFLKGCFTKQTLLKYIEGIMALYNFTLGELKAQIETVKKEEKKSAENQLRLTVLMELVIDLEIEKLSNTIYDEPYKKLYKAYPKLKTTVSSLSEIQVGRKLSHMKDRHKEIKSDLVWIY